VEGLFVDDDLGSLDTAVVSVLARDLQCRLVGLQPAVAEERVRQPGQRGESGGELLLQRHVVVVAGVDQLGDLLLQRGNQSGWACPSC